MSHKYHNPMRLKGYDYRSGGAYAITIKAKIGTRIFCHPHLRFILETEWAKLAERFPGVAPMTFMVMPDHLHCMLLIDGNVEDVCSVSDVIGAYKSIVYNVWQYYVYVNKIKLPTALWKRRFYDHIVRNEIDFANQTAYILNNPIKAKLKKQ
ncbi:hypothetical protein KDA_43430 [Dictyobacter alpinus]|uniref:Transposase IS200-like domain-containing protein n=1 Tax=Dictyobacter alpinus TaxID=2014873 RepID=A0A402BBZ5_9CHLR|nr:transposase [Dictyobacter alpinus]GCE28859.1 hypothetical protein KDA_43430 [Dictyobacter alpinus]